MGSSGCNGNCLPALADGAIIVEGQSSHANARNASSGTTAYPTSTRLQSAVMYMHAKGAWHISRAFMVFDTSGITTTVTSAKLYIRGYNNTSGDVQAVKSTWDGSSALHNSNFNDIDFGTEYASVVTSWTTSTSMNQITLNSTARADMKNNNKISFALINYDYDYKDTSTYLTKENGIYFTEYSGTNSDPELGYTAAAAGSPITLSAGVVTLSNGLITIN